VGLANLLHSLARLELSWEYNRPARNVEAQFISATVERVPYY
jgi:hypothetical protein